MKAAFFGFLAITLLSCACHAGFVLVDPATDQPNSYAEDGLELTFTITPEGFGVTISNKTDSLLQIHWDSCAYIDPTGHSRRLVEGSTRIIHSDLNQPPTSVPPGATASVVAYPPDFLVANKPTRVINDPILGQRLGLFLSMTKGIEPVERVFTFENRLATPGIASPGGKSGFAAGLWAFFIPSAGHAYAGNWLRGLPYLGLEVLFSAFAPTSSDSSQGKGEVQPNWANFAVLGVKILEIMDANREVGKWNQSHGFSIAPTRSGIEVAWLF
jgi:hypothetical protein